MLAPYAGMFVPEFSNVICQDAATRAGWSKQLDEGIYEPIRPPGNAICSHKYSQDFTAADTSIMNLIHYCDIELFS